MDFTPSWLESWCGFPFSFATFKILVNLSDRIIFNFEFELLSLLVCLFGCLGKGLALQLGIRHRLGRAERLSLFKLHDPLTLFF
jgi:hypothetical protein